jgi:hypothetical protein
MLEFCGTGSAEIHRNQAMKPAMVAPRLYDTSKARHRRIVDCPRHDDRGPQPSLAGGKQYVPLVAKVGVDGNEIAGVRLPDIARAARPYTGCNVYKGAFPEASSAIATAAMRPCPRPKPSAWPMPTRARSRISTALRRATSQR